jgi:hypothetical protein
MIMSKTNSESREVRESRELTNDELAPVVGGRNEAQEGFKDAKAAFARGDILGGMAALSDAYKAMGTGGGGGWL